MRRLLMSVLMVRIPSFGNKVLSSNIIINCNITFPASDCLSQTNNAMEGGLIRSKRIIRTIYGRSRRSTRQIHEAQCTLTSTAQCAIRRWFAREGGLWICGAELNWIAFMGRKTPTIAMKNLWILFRSKYKRYQASIIETLMDVIEFKLANQGR